MCEIQAENVKFDSLPPSPAPFLSEQEIFKFEHLVKGLRDTDTQSALISTGAELLSILTILSRHF